MREHLIVASAPTEEVKTKPKVFTRSVILVRALGLMIY
ncbi:hypothetical protein HMPREF9966_0980 [Streptococcus anginosus SK52 = DSM 20563]|nr:hypothetical protein HMPREF9966_0980 [Streptococcus anginosus SK52 = DSM 20563]